MENITPGAASSPENQILLFNLLQALQTISSFNGNVNHTSFANHFFNAIPKEGQNAVIWNHARLLKILTKGAVQVVELLEEAEKGMKEKNPASTFSKKNAITLTKIAEGLNVKLSTILQAQQSQKNLPSQPPKNDFSSPGGQRTFTEGKNSLPGQKLFQENALAKNLMEPVRLAIKTLSFAKCLTPSDATSILNKLEKTTLLIDRMIHADAEKLPAQKGKDHSFQKAPVFSKNSPFKAKAPPLLPQTEKQQTPLLGKSALERRDRSSNFHPIQGNFHERKENDKKSNEVETQKCEQVFKIPKTEELLHLNHKKPSYSNLPVSSEKPALAGTEKILTLEPKNLLAAPYIAEKKRDRNATAPKKKQKKGYFSKPQEESPQDENHPSS
jgi:hypothetical protein